MESEKGTENLEGLTIRYDGLLSHCNRAKILIKLCILTVIAEHFCVFECMRVLLPVCMRSCVCTDASFFHLFSALILDLQYTSITSSHFSTSPSLHVTLIRLLFCFKTRKGMSGSSPPPLTANHTHLFNLVIIWNDQPVVIIDQTHLSVCDRRRPLLPTKKEKKKSL